LKQHKDNQNEKKMKKLILSFAILMTAAISGFAQEAAPQVDPKAPKIEFQTLDIDFGTIKQGSDPFRNVKFTNTGKTPLIITTCQGSCGCTVPTCPTEPTMPGEKGEMQVRYDTNRLGAFTKTVTVMSNAGNGTITLKIHGTVEAAETGLPEKKSGPTAQ